MNLTEKVIHTGDIVTNGSGGFGAYDASDNNTFIKEVYIKANSNNSRGMQFGKLKTILRNYIAI